MKVQYEWFSILRGGGGGQDCCHIERVPCLNFNYVIIITNFHNFLHIMIGQYFKKSNAKQK
jgi:hypothetical protein